jgi:hypothetical protein
VCFPCENHGFYLFLLKMQMSESVFKHKNALHARTAPFLPIYHRPTIPARKVPVNSPRLDTARIIRLRAVHQDAN